jgi:KDO2-lipid IV(A) lauroyltransferase
MTAKQLRQRLEALVAWAVWGVFKWLPVDAASGLAGGLARLVGPRLKVSRIARRNLARAFPAMTPAEIETVVAEVWDNLGRVAGEFPHVAWLAANRVEAVNLDVLHRLRDDGRPGLFVGAHLGNWELGPAMAFREGLPITLVYRAANNPWIEDLYRKGRGASAAERQIAKGPEGARDIMQVLRSAGHLAILVDQKMNDGIAVPFFGHEAMTAPAVARFAIKFDCPMVPVRIERLKGAHFRVTFHRPLELPRSGDVHADTLATMTAINAVLEEWISARPGQWLWLHRRWPE